MKLLIPHSNIPAFRFIFQGINERDTILEQCTYNYLYVQDGVFNAQCRIVQLIMIIIIINVAKCIRQLQCLSSVVEVHNK